MTEISPREWLIAEKKRRNIKETMIMCPHNIYKFCSCPKENRTSICYFFNASGLYMCEYYEQITLGIQE